MRSLPHRPPRVCCITRFDARRCLRRTAPGVPGMRPAGLHPAQRPAGASTPPALLPCRHPRFPVAMGARTPPPPRRQPVDLTLGDTPNAFPTDVPVVVDGGIATFASDFSGGFDAPAGSAASLPPGVVADVHFLCAWERPAHVYYGAGEYPLLPFTCACRPPHRSIPTAAQVVADLHKADFAANAPRGAQLGTANPRWVRKAWDEEGADQIYTDEAKQYLFCTAADVDERVDSAWPLWGADPAAERASRARNNGALQALRANVLGGHLFFVTMHTPKVVVGAPEDLKFLFFFPSGCS